MGRFPKTERQRRFIDLADSFGERFAARAAGYDLSGEFPYENFRDLHDAGYLALTIPEALGGLGANPLEFALAQERIAYACGSTGLATTMHLSLLGRQGALQLWPVDVYQRIVTDVIEHGALINAANSEPELGSPSRGALPNTTATRTATGWRINGRKSWASLAPALSYVSTLAAVIDGDQPAERGSFLFRTDLPGVRVEETWNNLGMRATGSHDLVFEEVDVPFEARVPFEGSDKIGAGAGWSSFPIAAVYLGIATAARDAAVTFARDRRPTALGGSAIAELQTVQQRIAEIELLLWQARSAVYETAEQWVECPEQRGELSWELAAMKYTVTNNAIQVADLAMRVVGSVSLQLSNAIQRFHRDIRTGLGHPPMDDAALTFIGKTALGLLAPSGPALPEGNDGRGVATPARK